MEAFAQKVLTLTRTRPIFDTLLLESHTPDGLAIIPFALAALSGCTLLLLQLAPIKFLSGRKSEVDDRKAEAREINILWLLPFRVTRLILSFVLLALSAYDIISEQHQSLGVLICLVLFYVYTTVLSFIPLTASTTYWRANATRHVTTLYFVIFVIYAFYFLRTLVLFDQEETKAAGGSSVGWARFWLLAIVGVVIPLFMPRPFTPTPSQETPNPEQTASYFSLLTYSYLDRLILQAFRVPHLKLEELPPLQEKHTAAFVCERAFPLIDPTKVDAKKRHIFWRLSVYLRTAYVQLFFSYAAWTLSRFIAPYALKQLLEDLEQAHAQTGEMVRPWVWVVLIGLGPIISSIFDQLNYVTSTRITVHMEAILTQLVFEQSMRIRLNAPTPKAEKNEKSKRPEATQPPPPPPAEAIPESQTVNEAAAQAEGETTEGASSSPAGSGSDSRSTASTSTATAVETPRKPKDVTSDSNQPGKSLIGVMTNLVTTDLEILKMPAGHLLEIPFSVFTMILSVFFLYSILGWSSLLGVLTMVVALPAPALLSRLIMTTQKEKMKCTDDRVQTVSQNINVMRMIKLFAWEPKIEDQIFQRRQKELRLIRKGRIIENATQFVQSLLPLASMVVTYATFTMVMKQELSASVVYSSMAVFNILRQNLRGTFWYVPIFLRAKVSLDRFNEFFAETKLISEVNEVEVISEAPSNDIKFYPSTYTWTSAEDTTSRDAHGNHRFVLQVDEEVTFQHGAINLILGPTASGKTSVLMALLGEMYSTSNDSGRTCNFPRESGVAYAAQESWVLNDTIRNNVLFGEAYDEERYQKTLAQCALEPDIDRFEAGDLTEVGEKGITLSGGQKARVTLARAVYSRAQTILLDDVLSALDVHTAKWIVDKCLRGDILQGRTVLLVTHNVALAAPVASFCVELSSDGRIIRQGPLEDVISHSTVLQEEAKMTLKEMENVDNDAKEHLDDKSSKGKLVVAEEIALGRVAWPAVKLYVNEVGGSIFWTFFLAGIIACCVFGTMQIWFLGYWAAQYNIQEPGSVPIGKYLGIYVALACAGFVLQRIAEIWYLFGTIRASRAIHVKLVSSVFRATLRWLDTVPLARVISRCTTDIEAIDDNMSSMLEGLIKITAFLLVTLIAVISMAGWISALLGVIVFAAGAGCGMVYLRAQLCIKRENSNAKSPVISHFHAALGGLVSIRAYGAQAAFKAKARENIDRYNRSAYALYDLNRWIAIRSDVCGGLFSGLVSAYLVYGNKGIIASDIGYALNQILAFSGNLLFFVRVYNMFEVQANSAERIRDFLLIDHEPSPTEDGKPPAYWPASGHLKAENLSARYSTDGPLVLQNLTFNIRSGERIGIVGRTGAGKSTFSLALLRGIPTSGQVYFDGRDISQTNLDALRSSMTLIPQQPELMAGNLRENLDPFSQHDDATLYSALRSAGLLNLSSSRDASSSNLTALASTTLPSSADQSQERSNNVTLDTYIEAGGSNFSLGQRQIVALARAMVRQSKVLLLDEATASIDHDTDAAIQRAIRTELSQDTTVITVAHRLQTIMDSDRIMVLDAGNLVEFDSPAALLSKESSYFKKMVDESMDKEKLFDLAGL